VCIFLFSGSFSSFFLNHYVVTLFPTRDEKRDQESISNIAKNSSASVKNTSTENEANVEEEAEQLLFGSLL
jgi:hypothetical protein